MNTPTTNPTTSPIVEEKNTTILALGLAALTLAISGTTAALVSTPILNLGWLILLPLFGIVFGMHHAVKRKQRGLAIILLFALGALLGADAGPYLHAFADAQQIITSALITLLLTCLFGSIGWVTKRDLSRLHTILFWSLLASIVILIGLYFVSLPLIEAIITPILIGIFCGFLIVDFNRLKKKEADPILLAAAIYLDVWNLFLLIVSLGRR